VLALVFAVGEKQRTIDGTREAAEQGEGHFEPRGHRGAAVGAQLHHPLTRNLFVLVCRLNWRSDHFGFEIECHDEERRISVERIDRGRQRARDRLDATQAVHRAGAIGNEPEHSLLRLRHGGCPVATQ
jgi:hypothetical protein